MALLEETLVGFQLIDSIGTGNNTVTQSAKTLRVEDELEVVKERTETNCKAADLEVSTRLVKFLDGFNDKKLVKRALKEFGVSKAVLDRDVAEVVHHTGSVRAVTGLLSAVGEMRPHGDLLSLYRGQTPFVADPDDVLDEGFRMEIAFQDLVNAMAFELRGVCSYDGSVKYKTVQQIHSVVWARVGAARNVLLNVPDSTRANSVVKVFRYVEKSLLDATTKDELRTLSEYIDLRVAQLPLVRRWWNYGS